MCLWYYDRVNGIFLWGNETIRKTGPFAFTIRYSNFIKETFYVRSIVKYIWIKNDFDLSQTKLLLLVVGLYNKLVCICGWFEEYLYTALCRAFFLVSPILLILFCDFCVSLNVFSGQNFAFLFLFSVIFLIQYLLQKI